MVFTIGLKKYYFQIKIKYLVYYAIPTGYNFN